MKWHSLKASREVHPKKEQDKSIKSLPEKKDVLVKLFTALEKALCFMFLMG